MHLLLLHLIGNGDLAFFIDFMLSTNNFVILLEHLLHIFVVCLAAEAQICIRLM